jgi:hypothetical protein
VQVKQAQCVVQLRRKLVLRLRRKVRRLGARHVYGQLSQRIVRQFLGARDVLKQLYVNKNKSEQGMEDYIKNSGAKIGQ